MMDRACEGNDRRQLALDLDFVPLASERYDLIVPIEQYESEKLAPLLGIIRDPGREFAASVEALGGYDTAQMGAELGSL